MSPQIDIVVLWRRATEVVFDRSDRFGPLNQSMRAAVPIALEGGTLVVGLSGAHQYLAGHLQTPANRHRVTEVLRELSGKPLEMRLIEGTAMDDWENVRKADQSQRAKAQGAAGAAPAAPAEPGQASTEAAGIWGELHQRIHFSWQSWPQRSLPVSRALFVQQALPLVAEAEAEAAGRGDAEEAIQRGLTRVLDRIASMSDIPVGVLALEFLRLPRAVRAAAKPEKPEKPEKHEKHEKPEKHEKKGKR